jgi:hypothetical protein
MSPEPERVRLEEVLSARSIPLPRDIIPFILENLEGFDATIENGEWIKIMPRGDTFITPQSRSRLSHLAHQAAHQAAHPTAVPVLRPKFSYTIANRDYTPDQAEAFGMSKPRLKVYKTIYEAGGDGAGYKVIRSKSGLPHGSVQQILHWLRKQKLIHGEPE